MLKPSTLALISVLLASPSCSSLKPDGAMKSLSEGSVFEGTTPSVPPDNHHPEPAAKPPMRWKMDF